MNNLALDRSAAAAHAPRPPQHDDSSLRRMLNTTDGLVSVAAQAWRPDSAVTTGMQDAPRDAAASRPSLSPDALDVSDASPSLRDEFLEALDGTDAARSRRLAMHLTRCRHALPGLVCVALGLAHGSTYGRAARLVLHRMAG